jgi:hypothetical protein
VAQQASPTAPHVTGFAPVVEQLPFAAHAPLFAPQVAPAAAQTPARQQPVVHAWSAQQA